MHVYLAGGEVKVEMTQQEFDTLRPRDRYVRADGRRAAWVTFRKVRVIATVKIVPIIESERR